MLRFVAVPKYALGWGPLNVRILVLVWTVKMPNLALIQMKRITVYVRVYLCKIIADELQ
jgi:hypothetical protein